MRLLQNFCICYKKNNPRVFLYLGKYVVQGLIKEAAPSHHICVFLGAICANYCPWQDPGDEWISEKRHCVRPLANQSNTPGPMNHKIASTSTHRCMPHMSHALKPVEGSPPEFPQPNWTSCSPATFPRRVMRTLKQACPRQKKKPL